MKTMHMCKLSEVCVQDRNSVKVGQETNLRYIGLESIDSNSGMFVDGVLSKTPESPKANSFRFSNKHVLYGKLRPYLNKVALPYFDGKCSTEIIPLLPDERLIRDYLAFFLRTKQTVSSITEKTSGARMPRADMDFVLSLEIRLPSIDEQHRIVDILKRADSICRLRKQAHVTARQLIPALFIDMFGDPATNPKKWPLAALDRLSMEMRYGTSKKCHDVPEGNDLPVLRIPNIIGGEISWEGLKYTTLPEKEVKKLSVTPGDLLFVRTNGNPDYIGRCAVFSGKRKGLFASYLIRVRLNTKADCNPYYVRTALSMPSYRDLVVRQSKTTAGNYNISTQGLKALKIPCPPLELQSIFLGQLGDISSILKQQEIATINAEDSFQSLLHRAFNGEL